MIFQLRQFCFPLVLCFLHLSSLPAQNPSAADYYQAGLAAKEQGNYDQAARELIKAITIDPTYTEAHWALAWVYAEQGQRQEEAIREFLLVLRLSDDPHQIREARQAIIRLGGNPTPSSLGEGKRRETPVSTGSVRHWLSDFRPWFLSGGVFLLALFLLFRWRQRRTGRVRPSVGQ